MLATIITAGPEKTALPISANPADAPATTRGDRRAAKDATWRTKRPANMHGSAKASTRVSPTEPESAAPARLASAQVVQAARLRPAIHAGCKVPRFAAITKVSSVSCRPKIGRAHV